MNTLQHSFNAHVQPPIWDWIAYRTEHAGRLEAIARGTENADIGIGVQAAYTTDFLVHVLEAKLLRYGRAPRVFAGGFNQFRQELLTPSGAHYAAKPAVTELLLNPRESATDAGFQEVERIVRTHEAALPDALFIVSNLFCACGDRQKTKTIRDWNDRLYDLAAAHPGMRILDMDTWVGRWGASRVVDPKHEFLAGMLIAPEMVPQLAEEILAFVYERLGLRKKCLVLDLDETLWGGIVGEEGMNGIQLDVQPPGNVYRAIQEAALALRAKGVLLAVASKNNPPDAIEVIDKHPHQVLRREHFAAMEIGWQTKDQMIRSIAKTLNIGVDSLVFLDDNPNERELVRRLLPSVTVLDPPADPAWWPRYLQGLRCFEASTLTAEDKNRARMYEEEKNRRELQESTGTIEDYLRSIETVMTVGFLKSKDDENLARVAQLSQRTNQFNLTTRRYTEGDLAAITKVGGRVYWMKVGDRLGDSGLVGVAVVRRNGRNASNGDGDLQIYKIENFFMSCRVIGRQVERAFLQEILADLKKSGAQSVTAEYIPSEKNMQTNSFYDDNGFEADNGPTVATKYGMSLAGRSFPPVPYIRVEWPA